jgi:hypothetical protein
MGIFLFVLVIEMFFLLIQEDAPLTVETVHRDAQDLRSSLLELRDEVRQDREVSILSHVSHKETDDRVANDELGAHLKLAGFRPVVTNLHGEELNPKSSDAPIYDVTVSSAAASLAIRDRFGFLINEPRRSKTPLPPFLSGVYISNLVNLSTVVKVEVLKVLKEQYNSRYTKTSNRTAFVKSFTSRPTFHVRPLQRGAGSHQTYGYPEAVSHFRDLLTFENLEPAYKRVGLNFIGELQYRFLVLNEAGRDQLISVF